MAEIRAKYRPTSRRSCKPRASHPQGSATRNHGPRDQDRPRRMPRARRARTSARAAHVWTRAELEKGPQGIDWGTLLGRRPDRIRAEVRGVSRQRHSQAGGAGRLGRCQNWKEWLAFHTLNQQANVLRRRSATRVRFLRDDAGGHSQAAAARPVGADATSNACRTRSARPCGNISSLAKTEVQGMVSNIKAAFAKKVRRSRGWRRRPRKRRSRRSRRSWSESATDSWRDYRVADDHSRQRLLPTRRTRASPSTGTRSPRRQAVDRAMVDAAAVVNAVNLRCRTRSLPRRDPAAAVLDPKADMAFNYGAIGSVISGTRSATASTTNARCSIRRGAQDWNWGPAGLRPLPAGGEALIAQYNQYEALPAARDRQADAGENIARWQARRGI